MNWIKKGIIYTPNFDDSWKNNSGLQPTPIVLKDRIRVFVGHRDSDGVGRIGFIDLDKSDPSRILGESDIPALDIGEDGCFDDNGVIPCAVLKKGKEIHLYYAGYQIVKKTRFTVFGGLAISKDEGKTFKRFSKAPVLDRANEDTLFRVIHSIIPEDEGFKVYYGGGSNFIQGENKSLPVYIIKQFNSTSSNSFPNYGKTAIGIKEDEHRVGRPYVIKTKKKYLMFYGIGTETTPYKLAYAESKDGDNWTEKDDLQGLELSENSWDSEMMAYPSVVQSDSKCFIFYNGNNYGRQGFGYAELKGDLE